MKWYKKSPVFCMIGVAMVLIMATLLNGCLSKGPSVITETENVTEVDLSAIDMGNHVAYIPINRNGVTGKQFTDVLDRFESERDVHIVSWSTNSCGGDLSNSAKNKTLGICVTFEPNP